MVLLKEQMIFVLFSLSIISAKTTVLLLLITRERQKRCMRELDLDDWKEAPLFDLELFTNREARVLFRFRKSELTDLKNALRIPDIFITPTGDVVAGIEALCILLRRLAYPNRLIELRRLFGRAESVLSRIFHAMLRHIDSNFRVLLESWNHSWLEEDDFERYADAIVLKGGVSHGCFGFIDGTARPICRPKFFQRECFSGHKRVHCIKWQSVVLPNGLIGNLLGGKRGSMHDARLFHESGIADLLRAKMASFAERHYKMYGDSGYGRNDVLDTPYSIAQCLADPEKGDDNLAMSQVRQAVEWNFKDVVANFALIDLKNR